MQDDLPSDEELMLHPQTLAMQSFFNADMFIESTDLSIDGCIVGGEWFAARFVTRGHDFSSPDPCHATCHDVMSSGGTAAVETWLYVSELPSQCLAEMDERVRRYNAWNCVGLSRDVHIGAQHSGNE